MWLSNNKRNIIVNTIPRSDWFTTIQWKLHESV